MVDKVVRFLCLPLALPSLRHRPNNSEDVSERLGERHYQASGSVLNLSFCSTSRNFTVLSRSASSQPIERVAYRQTSQALPQVSSASPSTRGSSDEEERSTNWSGSQAHLGNIFIFIWEREGKSPGKCRKGDRGSTNAVLNDASMASTSQARINGDRTSRSSGSMPSKVKRRRAGATSWAVASALVGLLAASLLGLTNASPVTDAYGRATSSLERRERTNYTDPNDHGGQMLTVSASPLFPCCGNG